MIRKGFLFPSMKKSLLESLEIVSSKITLFKNKKFSKLLLLNAKKRMLLYKEYIGSSDYVELKREKRLQLIINIYQIENFLSTLYLYKIPEKIFKEMKKVDNINDRMNNLMEKYPLMFITQWKIVETNKDYGIAPKKDIISGLKSISQPRQRNDLSELIKEVLKENTTLKQIIVEMKDLNANNSYLKKESKKALSLE